MNDLASADVDRYMTGVTDQIAGFRFTVADALAYACLCTGSSRQRDPESGVYALSESGAVRTVGQACTAAYIRIAYELQTIGCNCSAAAASQNGTAHR